MSKSGCMIYNHKGTERISTTLLAYYWTKMDLFIIYFRHSFVLPLLEMNEMHILLKDNILLPVITTRSNPVLSLSHFLFTPLLIGQYSRHCISDFLCSEGYIFCLKCEVLPQNRLNELKSTIKLFPYDK